MAGCSNRLLGHRSTLLHRPALFFAGNHGSARRGGENSLSARGDGPDGTELQGGRRQAINQWCPRGMNARLSVIEIWTLTGPTADFTEGPANDEASGVAALNAGAAGGCIRPARRG